MEESFNTGQHNNVFDADRRSRVIDFQGASWTNGYILRNENNTEWHDTGRHVLQWSMKFDETYLINVKLRTNQGTRYLRYTAVDYDGLGDQTIINFGLGSDTQDGHWRTFVRDLQQDLTLAQPGLSMLEVNAFFVRSSGRVDDILLGY